MKRSSERLVVVTGGRSFEGVEDLRNALAILKPTTIYQGGQEGADEIAAKWARSRGVQVATFEYQEAHGRAGGPRRNGVMIATARLWFDAGASVVVLVCPGGRGTADCRRQAEDALLPVKLLSEWGGWPTGL